MIEKDVIDLVRIQDGVGYCESYHSYVVFCSDKAFFV